MAKLNGLEIMLAGLKGAKIVSTTLIGQDENGGNIYEQLFDDGTTAQFVAPKGEQGEGVTLPDNVMQTDKEQTITGETIFNNGMLKADNIKLKDGTDIVLDNGSTTIYGNANRAFSIKGSGERPTYNDTEMALLTDIPDRVIETWKSSDSLTWYRKWNSGLIEQWGVIPSNQGARTVTLPTEFTTTTYILQCTPEGSSNYTVLTIKPYNRTTTSFDCITTYNSGQLAGEGGWYYACGY